MAGEDAVMTDDSRALLNESAEGLNRFSPAVCFAIPVRDDRLQEFYDLEQPPSVVEGSWIDEDSAVIAVETRTHGAELRRVEAGRGASGVAVALTILGIVADTGGAIALMVGAAKVVKDVWRKLRKTKRGIISISSGAAALLALDSAVNRLGSDQVRLVSFGAIDPQADSSYSEFDVYWVVIEAVDAEVIEFYLVSDKGDVTFAGRAARPVDPYNR
jgi:hypothetical protein